MRFCRARAQLLLAHGARTDIRDTLWNGTALGRAVHTGKREIEDYLRGKMAAAAAP